MGQRTLVRPRHMPYWKSGQFDEAHLSHTTWDATGKRGSATEAGVGECGQTTTIVHYALISLKEMMSFRRHIQSQLFFSPLCFLY